MAASPKYTKEKLNYYRICYLTTDILTEGLRSIFKQEWDNRYKATLGEWKDDPKSGMNFYDQESRSNIIRNRHLLGLMLNGYRAEWDCNMLFYAILDSDCIGKDLSPTVKTNVDILRKFRIKEFADLRRGRLTDEDFQNAIVKMYGAFQALGLSTKQIDDVKNQTGFPTEELRFALSTHLKHFSPDHIDVAIIYTDLGDIHMKLGDLERAKEYQYRALAIRLKKLGPDHTDVATTYSNLGLIYLRLGDLERAKKYGDLAFDI